MSVRVRNRGYSLLVQQAPAPEREQRRFSSDDGNVGPQPVLSSALSSVARTLRVRASLPSLFQASGWRLSRAATTPATELTVPVAGQSRHEDASETVGEECSSPVSETASDKQRRRRSSGVRREPSRLAAALGVSTDDAHHDQRLVDHLDVIDAHVATVSSLTNAANSILVPPLPFYNRAPAVDLESVVRDDATSLSVRNAPSVRSVQRPEDMNEIDKHVSEVLGHRAQLKRQLRGLWAFLKTPTGVVTAIYGFLVAFWGAAIVFFLGKLINLHDANRQAVWVEISCQVENALFTITGVGLIPWRVIDTYRIARIWYYKRVIRNRRRQRGLPRMHDENDIPDVSDTPDEEEVLQPAQREQLQLQQTKFSQSQTWYRPHRTATHKAFPITLALWICLLVDGNSIFQCMLCGCMWGMNRFERPAWTTGTLVPASFLCGIAAGVLIWYGGMQTKKTLEVENRLRKALEGLEDAEAHRHNVPTSSKSVPPTPAGDDYDEEAALR